MQNSRVLIAKSGLDGHDRGAKIVARSLRDQGCEVIYSGLHQSVREITRTAIQEDVIGIGLSVLSGAHMTIFTELIKELRLQQAEDIIVFGGGIIPDSDIQVLKMQGVSEIFGPGSSLSDISDWVRDNIVAKNLKGH